MQKIAHICTSSYSYGILLGKLQLLSQKGYDVHLISSNDGYDENTLENLDITLQFVKMNREIKPLEDIISIIRMVRLLKKEKYDIVHTHTAKAGIIGRLAAKLSRVPIIIHTSHGLPFYEGQSPLKYKTYKLLEKIGAYFCDALSSQNKEDLKELRKLNSKKPIYYEGNGVDLQCLDDKLLQIKDEMSMELRKSLSVEKQTVVILVVARLEPVKDHLFLIEGLVELKKHFHDFVCLLAGEGPLKAEIVSLIKKKHLENHVKLIGYQDDIYPFIKMADIIALTSIKEGIPRCIMEAMTFSKAVVATNVLGTKELVQDNYTGILVEYKNVKLLARAFEYLSEDPAKRESSGRNGRKVIEEDYTEEIVVRRLVTIYKELQKKKGLLWKKDSDKELQF
ncbi:glycosyltransferase family 4 protein [Bacillus massiliigorillae]|uniref:glycosyltransferase family 4 protein n=1 Tax=Bacillus massiliigorillae TaxID=1243664 RepID=UPI00039CED70|nr:glycosyltransferase family 4 protein [Bacillus massiliigorillae]